MPIWTDIEIRSLNEIKAGDFKLTEEVLQTRLIIVGGPFPELFMMLLKRLDSAIEFCNPDTIIASILKYENAGDDTYSHRIVHITSTDPFHHDSIRLEFATPRVAERVFEKMMNTRGAIIILRGKPWLPVLGEQC